MQEPKATPPDEGQEGRPDQQGPTDGHRRRMGMSENLADLAVRSSYEQIRESATGEAGAVWKAADREENNLR